MKCEGCPALWTEGYEYPESFCAVYPESECVEFKDGSWGCYHKLKTIKKRLEQREEIELHQWDGFAEWYEEDQKIENAVKEAMRNTFDLSNTLLAYAFGEEIIEAKTTDEIPSLFYDFIFRFRQALEYQGYDIVKRENKNNEDNQA